MNIFTDYALSEIGFGFRTRKDPNNFGVVIEISVIHYVRVSLSHSLLSAFVPVLNGPVPFGLFHHRGIVPTVNIFRTFCSFAHCYKSEKRIFGFVLICIYFLFVLWNFRLVLSAPFFSWQSNFVGFIIFMIGETRENA